MVSYANGVKCSLVEVVKRKSLRWFGHLEKKKSEEFVKKVYVTEIDDPRRRKRRPVVRWIDRVKEYMHERHADRGGGIKKARRGCVHRES